MSRRVLAVLMLTACGGGTDPASGEWAYVDEQEVENTCGVDYDGTTGSFFLTNHGDGTLVIDPNDGSDPFTCTLSDADYDCPSRYQEDVDLGYGATAEVSVGASGTFDSDTSGTGEQQATFSCKNSECTQVAQLAGIPDPCTITVTHDIEWLREAE